jgi:metal-responsive CopG/Arc/MetJ family transcriptional regulator
VAKVLVSVPEDLLREIDARARSLGQSRSEYLRGLAEAEIEEDERRRREEANRLLDLIKAEFTDDEPPVDVVKLIREDRESH